MLRRRILCLWLPYWATTRLRHARIRSSADTPADEMLATVQAVRGVRRLQAVCPQAAAAGLQPGQTLTQARALAPGLIAADAQPAEDAAALAALAQWCTRATPLAAPCPPDGIWLDVGGCGHLWADGEAGLAAQLAARLAGWGLVVRWAIAATPGAAWALARHAHGSVVGDGNALAALPVDALRLDGTTEAGLRRLGLTTIGALARLPRGELAARFPATGAPGPTLRLDQAFGHATEAIAWPPPPTDWAEHERLAEPVVTTDGCQALLGLLAGRLCARLAEKRLGGRQFVASFQRLDGSVQTLAVATALPVADPAYVVRLLDERLDGLDPGYGIEQASLAAPSIEAADARQEDLLAAATNATPLAQLIDALANRLKGGRLWRFAPRDSHLPERAVQAVPALAAAGARAPATPWQDDPASPRPIRLLAPPERIEVTAPLPDDPPMQFRWRGVLHRVRAATGPERIGGEWWTGDAGAPRDYYAVEDSQGSRFWMFRDASTWFLHGLFG